MKIIKISQSEDFEIDEIPSEPEVVDPYAK